MTVNIDYTGKLVVVSGGASDINHGIAECFAEHGENVARNLILQILNYRDIKGVV